MTEYFFFPPKISRKLPMLILGFEDQRKMASVAVNVHQVRTFQSASCHGCPAGRAQWVQESGGEIRAKLQFGRRRQRSWDYAAEEGHGHLPFCQWKKMLRRSLIWPCVTSFLGCCISQCSFHNQFHPDFIPCVISTLATIWSHWGKLHKKGMAHFLS